MQSSKTNFVIMTEDKVFCKFMYSTNFYDFDSEGYLKIMDQEKLNGSYIVQE